MDLWAMQFPTSSSMRKSRFARVSFAARLNADRALGRQRQANLLERDAGTRTSPDALQLMRVNRIRAASIRAANIRAANIRPFLGVDWTRRARGA